MVKQLNYKGSVWDYEESFYDDDEDPYFYDISFLLGNDRIHSHGIIITGSGVSIDWHSKSARVEAGGCTHTNIVPKSLFPNKKKLTRSDLIHIINLLRKTKFEGKFINRDKMLDLYGKWIHSLEDNDEV